MSQIMLQEKFNIEAGNFTNAGQASATIKRKLKQLGIPADVLRRVAVACYEVELNLVIHSMGGCLTFEVTPEEVRLLSKDVGPGIHDIDKAMTEGFSTANQEARSMGFGAGMGLPNMKRNADGFDIKSTIGVGTSIDMLFSIKEREDAL
jgi:Anti-sigma regulatory factor (Ser/Thr protein kinase)